MMAACLKVNKDCMKIGFDNEKYLRIQSEHIKERIAQFGDKLYMEFGGKLFDDYHAARVLPGFQPDSKLKMLMQLKDDAEIVIVTGLPMIRMFFACAMCSRSGGFWSQALSSLISMVSLRQWHSESASNAWEVCAYIIIISLRAIPPTWN